MATQYLDKMDSYDKQRVRLSKACIRHPNVEDCGRALSDLNHGQFIQMREAIIQLRNQYATMYHIVANNWQMITQPRANYI